MSTPWIALLRGMNVGGHRITNADLAAAFEQMGMAHVATFRASGNVLFRADGDEDPLARRIESGLREALGYEVPTFLRPADAWDAIRQPFSAEELAASKGKTQVTFLARAPASADREAVLALSTPDDRLALIGRELYWLPVGGTLDSALDHAFVTARLGVGTTRTLGTVEGIRKKLAKL